VSGTVALVQETHAKEIEEVRLKDARRRAVEHFEFFTKRRSDEVERFENLEAAATDWERAARIRAFADAVEAEAKSCGELSPKQRDWLAWVRAKADWLDALSKFPTQFSTRRSQKNRVIGSHTQVLNGRSIGLGRSFTEVFVLQSPNSTGRGCGSEELSEFIGILFGHQLLYFVSNGQDMVSGRIASPDRRRFGVFLSTQGK